MRKRLLVIVILIMCFNIGFADDYRGKVNINDPISVFFSSLYNNPATRKYLYRKSFWEVNTSFKFDKGNTIVQNGDKSSAFLINTHSYLRKADKLFYGDLQFKKGKRDNVLWSESSDYELLGPYVLADLDGGDMNFEEYFFLGGISKQVGGISYGLEASYRARYEYRLVDPRPRNIVSQFRIKLGSAIDLFESSILGMDICYEKYSQQNSIKLFKRDAKQKIFHMKGFGYYDIMFSKVYGELMVYHDIQSWSGSMQYFSKDREGLFTQLSFKKSTLEQDLDKFNDINIFQLKTNRLKADIGYSFGKSLLTKIHARLNTRSGFENIYENISFNNYRRTTVYNNYRSFVCELGNSYLFLFYDKKQNIGIDISYLRDKREYISSRSLMDISSLNSMISYGFSKVTFSTDFYVGYSKNLSSRINLNDMMMAPMVKEEMLIPNYEYLTSDKFLIGGSVNYKYMFSVDKALFIRGDYKMEYRRTNSLYSNVVITTGILF